VGVRISPSGVWGAVSDSDPQTTFGYFTLRLNDYGLAFLQVIEPRVNGTDTVDEHQAPVASASLRRIYGGTMISAGRLDRAGAEAILERGDTDLVAFGRFFTSNPDLSERLRLDLPLTHYERDAFWGGTEHWYTDFAPQRRGQGRALIRGRASVD
jgi:N-ethylmaleimide reductase